MSFQINVFKEHIRSANGHFEWFKTSHLHNLIVLLEGFPASTTAQQIGIELANVPPDRQVKYKTALDYLRANIPLGNVGVTQSALVLGLANLSTVVPNLTPSPIMRPDMTKKLTPSVPTANFSNKVKEFDKVSRKNVVLSGHGCWAQEGTLGVYSAGVSQNSGWLFIDLKAGQEIHFYCAHKTPLANSVGQLLDNHQQVAPFEIIKGPRSYYDYTLQPKGTLKLMNRMKGTGGNSLDARFLTVTAKTRLHDLISAQENSTAIFHWAACRVVFNKFGQKEDPISGNWLTWNSTTKAWA